VLETTLIKAFKPTHIGTEGLPWHPFTPYSDQVMLKLLHIDPVRGEVVALLKAPGGANLGTHNHYGRVLVYTVQGSWGYAEHDWVAHPGDFVYEVANAQHTFLAEPGEDVIAFVAIEGALDFLDENGNSVGIETARTFQERYEAYCAEQGIAPVDLTEFSLS
jgi:2,4'-dihydroxyacetophenone dioxygenase